MGRQAANLESLELIVYNFFGAHQRSPVERRQLPVHSDAIESERVALAIKRYSAVAIGCLLGFALEDEARDKSGGPEEVEEGRCSHLVHVTHDIEDLPDRHALSFERQRAP